MADYAQVQKALIENIILEAPLEKQDQVRRYFEFRSESVKNFGLVCGTYLGSAIALFMQRKSINFAKYKWPIIKQPMHHFSVQCMLPMFILPPLTFAFNQYSAKKLGVDLWDETSKSEMKHYFEIWNQRNQAAAQNQRNFSSTTATSSPVAAETGSNAAYTYDRLGSNQAIQSQSNQNSNFFDPVSAENATQKKLYKEAENSIFKPEMAQVGERKVRNSIAIADNEDIVRKIIATYSGDKREIEQYFNYQRDSAKIPHGALITFMFLGLISSALLKKQIVSGLEVKKMVWPVINRPVTYRSMVAFYPFVCMSGITAGELYYNAKHGTLGNLAPFNLIAGRPSGAGFQEMYLERFKQSVTNPLDFQIWLDSPEQ